ncbi:potassium voltage-gated channel subfamily C member 1-like [Biomphalaria glabrata]|uniref:Potassium voltage-gated channel subfamily C member 1-like n=1 Tax=Biomphalaria glabrata TaxID=6526 RepID=A0A9W3BHS9_BIOGL|nr:potassium voltage-gated channel subfamily C member 1-like [Biomphalaria glabrata]
MQLARGQSLLPKTSAKNSNRMTLNVGGVRYETYRSTLKTIPDTRLAWVTDTSVNSPDYDPATGEYFFDRHPGIFNMILNYYRTGKLHAPTHVCGPLFEEELAFWGIDEKQIEPCCWPNYRAHRDAQETLAEFDKDNTNDEDCGESHEEEMARRFGLVQQVTIKKSWFERLHGQWHERWRPKVWALLEDPASSMAAKVVTAVTSVFVFLAIVTFCAETHPFFRYVKHNVSLSNVTSVKDAQRLTEPYMFLKVSEGTCMVYFTLDILIRLLVCPDKVKYILQTQTVLDILSVLPFYIRQIVVAVDSDLDTSDGLYFFNSVRLIMILRVLRLTRHFSGFKILGHTIKASAKELLLMILLLSIGVLTFSCLVYYAEQVVEEPANDFKNIPRGFWWAVVTMTTLGYGDMYPRTTLGYIVGAGCALCGLLMLALPVPVVVNNFTLYYSHAQAKLKLPKKTRKTLVGAADALKTSSADPESCFPSSMGSDSSLKSTKNDKPTRRNSVCPGGNDRSPSTDSGYRQDSLQEVYTGISVIYTDECDDVRYTASQKYLRSHSVKDFKNVASVTTDKVISRDKLFSRDDNYNKDGDESTFHEKPIKDIQNIAKRRRSLLPAYMAEIDI